MQVKREEVLSVTVHTKQATTIIPSKKFYDEPDTFMSNLNHVTDCFIWSW